MLNIAQVMVPMKAFRPPNFSPKYWGGGSEVVGVELGSRASPSRRGR